MQRVVLALLAATAIMGAACHSRGTLASAVPTPTPGLAVQLGSDLAPAVRTRVDALLHQVAPGVAELAADATPASTTLPAGTTVLAFGDAPFATAAVPASDLASAGSEGFVLRRAALESGVVVLGARGNPMSPDLDGQGATRGNDYGAYALLEQLGFAFLHPLAPVIPAQLVLPGTLDVRESPRWPVRGIHLHTMHPLELTDLLNGWGPAGTGDEAGWESQLPEWDSFLEWLIANRQNRVEWVLLSSDSWADFADGAVRAQRLKTLVDHAHGFGVAAGADAPIALTQQHTWRLVRSTGTLAEETAQIDAHLDWLMGAGFDFFSTESGTSEFTHPDPARMLAWMNEVAAHLDSAWGKRASIKIHASTGQTADGYTDPDTGAPLNFNFLPHYADPRLGVLPHTVQLYSLDDPAPTYGNGDFSEIHRFLSMEAGSRDVIWHPESAYWVSYDADVPLFLPVYGERRLHDLRLIAADEDAGVLGRGAHTGSRIQGQMLFSSGWEWGYWLNDLIAARAAWDPHTEISDDAQAFARALDPVVAPFGSLGEQLRTLLVEEALDQRALLVHGAVNGVTPADPYKRTGQAYMQGWESWDDVGELARQIPSLPRIATQPSKLGLIEMRNPLHDGPDYVHELEPLLAAMESDFDGSASSLEAIASQAAGPATPLIAEIADGARIDALRATQLHGLYDSVGGDPSIHDDAWRAQRLQDARAALDAAATVVARRESAYRVPVARIASWTPGPTAYPYRYLWTAHSLHYWWRDQAKAVIAPASPCYLNIVNPVDVAFGEGTYLDIDTTVSDLADAIGLDVISECLVAPASEPSYPPSGL